MNGSVIVEFEYYGALLPDKVSDSDLEKVRAAIAEVRADAVVSFMKAHGANFGYWHVSLWFKKPQWSNYEPICKGIARAMNKTPEINGKIASCNIIVKVRDAFNKFDLGHKIGDS